MNKFIKNNIFNACFLRINFYVKVKYISYISFKELIIENFKKNTIFAYNFFSSIIQLNIRLTNTNNGKYFGDTNNGKS